MYLNECTCSEGLHCECGCHCNDESPKAKPSVPVITDEDEKFLLDNLDDWD